ncbi:unnamed protein product [Closterium sp. NIES-53]
MRASIESVADMTIAASTHGRSSAVPPGPATSPPLPPHSTHPPHPRPSPYLGNTPANNPPSISTHGMSSAEPPGLATSPRLPAPGGTSPPPPPHNTHPPCPPAAARPLLRMPTHLPGSFPPRGRP